MLDCMQPSKQEKKSPLQKANAGLPMAPSTQTQKARSKRSFFFPLIPNVRIRPALVLNPNANVKHPSSDIMVTDL